MKHFCKYLAVCLIAMAACDSEEPSLVDIGLDYFPLQTGFYQIYQVDETRYSEVAEPETLAYELMVEVVDSFPSTAGKYTYVIHRSTRDDANDDWQFLDTWSARIEDSEVIVQEGNAPFLKLILPIGNGTAWDGNKYNNLGEDEYLIKKVDEPYTLGGISFDKTLMVEQEKNEDPIVFRDVRKEIYARDAGLIYREITQLYYCTDPDCLGDQEIESGVTYKQQLKEYGIR